MMQEFEPRSRLIIYETDELHLDLHVFMRKIVIAFFIESRRGKTFWCLINK